MVYMGLRELYKREETQMFIDFCRIFIVILLLFIIVYMVKNIEAVKLLAYDPCKICMNKTGAVCFVPKFG